MVGEHFGKVPTYTIMDTDTGKVEIIDNVSEHTGDMGLPPELLKKHNVDIMLADSLGLRAIKLFERLGIMVYTGARGTARDALEMYENNLLPPATDVDACDEASDHVHLG